MNYIRELQVKYVKRRIPNNTLPETAIATPEEAARFFIHIIGNEPVERLVALFLNVRNEAVAYRQIAQGTVDQCSAYPAEIAKGALLANATAVVVAHNHPSGHLDPSPQDVAFIRKVRQVLDLLDINLHDFIIVNDCAKASFRELGLLPPSTRNHTS